MYFPEPNKCSKNFHYLVCACLQFFSKAEKFIESIEQNKNYPVLLLHLMDKADMDMFIRVSAAIAFKNFVKRNWRVVSGNVCQTDQTKCFNCVFYHEYFFLHQIEDVGDRIHEDDRNMVKQTVVGLMLKSPEKIQKQVLCGNVCHVK